MKIKLEHTRVFKVLWQSQKRLNAFRGGARSSKTWSILQAISYWLLTGKFGEQVIKTGSFAVVRETLPSLRASAYKDFIEILHQMEVYTKIDHRKTNLEFHFHGRSVNFFSTDDLNSAKLRGRKNEMVYINEANSVSFEAFTQLNLRCSQFMVLDYNPAGIENWCKTFIEGSEFKKGIVQLDVSTYHDNIDNLAQPMVDAIENLKDVDFDLYQVYNLGNWVKSRNLVFSKIHLIKQMPVEYEREYFGIDFGYHDNAVAVRVLKIGMNIFIEQIFHEPRLLLNSMAGKLHDFGAKKLYADHDLMTIKELKNRGIRIKKALKGRDSIRAGLGYIRQHKIHILQTSLETIKEFRNYKYELDENNNPTDKPLGLNDHSIDATRYALSYALRKSIVIR